jgi:hypothetical protein
MSKYGRITQSEIEIIAERTFTEGVTYALYYAEGGLDRAKAVADAADIVRDELEKAGALVQQKRRAIVELDEDDRERHLNLINNYLPANYTAELVAHPKEVKAYILIKGYDRAGWTLDGYVIPRLASGLIVAKEVK